MAARQRHLMTVLREYEDFYIRTGRTAHWTRPRHCGPWRIAPPTWTASGPTA
jgi:hypothetical protein